MSSYQENKNLENWTSKICSNFVHSTANTFSSTVMVNKKFRTLVAKMEKDREKVLFSNRHFNQFHSTLKMNESK
jgi:hypothetical protein